MEGGIGQSGLGTCLPGGVRGKLLLKGQVLGWGWGWWQDGRIRGERIGRWLLFGWSCHGVECVWVKCGSGNNCWGMCRWGLMRVDIGMLVRLVCWSALLDGSLCQLGQRVRWFLRGPMVAGGKSWNFASHSDAEEMSIVKRLGVQVPGSNYVLPFAREPNS